MGIVRRCITAFVACIAGAASSQEVEWVQNFNESASSISIAQNGEVWVTLLPSGLAAMWNGRGWARTNGGGSRIAAGANSVNGANQLLVIGDRNLIYLGRGIDAAISWSQVRTTFTHSGDPNRRFNFSYGIDVAIGGGQAWCIGMTSAGPQGNIIYRWDPTNLNELGKSSWAPVRGIGAARIAVDSRGGAWAIDNQSVVWRYVGSLWERTNIPPAKDIAFAADGTTFIVGTDGELMMQAGVQWKRMGGPKLKAVAVDPQGNPWGIKTDGLIARGVLRRPATWVTQATPIIRTNQFLPAYRQQNAIYPQGMFMKDSTGKTVAVMEQDGRLCLYRSGDPNVHRPFVRCIPSEPMPPGDAIMELRDDGNLCIVRPATRQAMWCQGTVGPRGTGYGYYGKLDADAFSVYTVNPGKPGSDRVWWSTTMQSNSSKSPYVTLSVGPPSPFGRIVGEGISCGAGPGHCAAEYPRGKDVQLSAEPTRNGRFNGWIVRPVPGTTIPDRNAICHDVKNPVCNAKLTEDQTARADFDAPRLAKLTVYPPRPEEAGNVVALVSFANQRAECPTPAGGCEYSIEQNTRVEIVSRARPGLEFWKGEGLCENQGDKCGFTMPSHKASVWLRTKAPPPQLPTVTLVPTEGRWMRAGAVFNVAPGTPQPFRMVTCPGECKLAVGAGQKVVIEVEAPHLLAGWGGACSAHNLAPAPPNRPNVNPVKHNCILIVTGDAFVQPAYR
jgi:hypothetical protein